MNLSFHVRINMNNLNTISLFDPIEISSTRINVHDSYNQITAAFTEIFTRSKYWL